MLTRESIGDGRANGFFQRLDEHFARVLAGPRLADRPYTTLAYAQSLDGSIAAVPGRMLQLSNPVSRRMTHHLRARHDAILVGINTVLTDDPQLTVRLTAGSHPRPIVIDGCLRMPLDARLLAGPGGRPIVATAETACTLKEERLREAGAFVMRLPCGSDGRVDLTALLERLAALKINSLMVEGGAGILSSFLNERLADQVVVTVSPRFVGGVPAVAAFGSGRARPMPRIRNVRYQPLAGDLIVWGDLKRTRARPARGDGL